MHRFKLALLVTLLAGAATTALAQNIQPIITQPIDESQSITLEGNTPAAALDAANDRGAVSETMRLEHMLLVLKRPAESEAALQKLIDDMHNSAAPAAYHRWLTPRQLGARFGLAPQDLNVIQGWLKSHGFAVNRIYGSSLVIDFSGTAAQVRDALHTEIHSLVLPNGEHHIANVRDPKIPAALAPAIHGVASLHDFFPRSHAVHLGPVRYDHTTNTWKPLYDIKIGGGVYHTLGPYDLATIYDLLPLWREGFTGKGVTIAAVEDSNLLHPGDWQKFRETFGLDQFTHATFRQIYPGCTNPGQNGDETEAALDVEWSSAAAPDANILLSACANSATTSGLDLAILGLLELSPQDTITDSYGLCEPITGAAEIALENLEAELATLEGTTFFIAQGDTGADECAPSEKPEYSVLGVNSGDNTASAYAVDIGGTDFMAQYNADVSKIPLSRYWSATNDPKTHASAKSYIPEIPWNDSCASRLIFTDPLIAGNYSQAFGEKGFCNSSVGQQFFLFDTAGSGGPSSCFTGTPSTSGVVSGTCKGNPKPTYQKGVEGVPHDGVRDH